jgi:hypothetical protein
MTTTGTTATLQIPDKPRVQGPLLAARVRRTVGIYLAVLVIGVLPSALGASAGARALGLGLVLPGGGFVFTSDPVLALASFAAAAFAFAFYLFLRANHVALPAVWVAAAIGAVFRTGTGLWEWAEWVVPLTALSALGVVFVRSRFLHRRARARAAQRNRYLETLSVVAPERPRVPPVGEELGPDDLAHQRWALDLALQPVDSWEGFDTGSQWLMNARRYQCNWLQWGLALGQYTRTPAFGGHLDVAQRNLVEKMRQREVWEYWRTENLFGNLDPNPDPIRRDNIMYSGYFALMLETYASNTGDDRYEQAESLSLRWDDHTTFEYDSARVSSAVEQNFEGAGDWAMFPCEPGFVFPVCNAIGMDALVIRDRRFGTGATEQLLDRFRQTLEQELMTADGTIISNVFARYGFSNTALASIVSDILTPVFLHPLVPEILQRNHEILRRESIRIDDGVHVQSRGLARRMDHSDPANSQRSPLFLLAALLAFATEAGDDDLAAAVRRRVAAEVDVTSDGRRRWFTGASVFANANWLLASMNRPWGWYDLVRVGMPEVWCRGPRLEAVPYPDVLVARAVTDGAALDLVLRPGDAGGRRRLRVTRLLPRHAYRADGAVAAEVQADDRGEAELEVDVGDRTAVRLAPAP